MEIVIWLIVGLVVGGVVGALATWGISRARGGAVSVMQLKQENDRFKNEVTEHFVETARLINQLTDSYKQVFDHLSSGAENLVDEKSLAERLPPASGQEVKLSQFGASATSGKDAGESGQTEGAKQASGEVRTSDRRAGSENGSSGSADPLKGGSSGAVSRSSTSSNGGETAGADSSSSKSADDAGDKAAEKEDGEAEDAAGGVSKTSAKSAGTSDQSSDESRAKD